MKSVNINVRGRWFFKKGTSKVPFGMTLPGRCYNAHTLRHGFTGHEKESDLAEGIYTTEYRLYDTRVGRWLSVDPLFEKYEGMSPYNYCMLNPVMMVDPDGRENIPAVKWALENMVNKNIKSDYSNPYFGSRDGRWSYKIGEVPTRTVCYESCFMAYMNSGDEVLKTLRTGFTTKSNSFLGRSHPKGGMTWFKQGNNDPMSGRKFITDIKDGQLGDIVFMGGSGEM